MKYTSNVRLAQHPLVVFGVLTHSLHHTNQPISTHLFSRMLYMRLLLASLSKRKVVAIVLTSLFATVSLQALYFMLPRSVAYSYAADTCISSPTLLPSLVSQSNTNQTYQAHVKPKISLGTFALYSQETCLQSSSIPDDNAVDTIHLKVGFLRKSIEVNASSLPKTKPKNLDTPIAHSDQLLFQLDQADKTFSYQLSVLDRTATCLVEDETISCPIDQFSLSQGSTYDYSLERVRNARTKETSTGTFTLLDPVAFLSSNVANSEIVYAKPSEITLTANKPLLSSAKVSLKTTTGDIVPIETLVDDTSIKIKLTEELARGASFVLTVAEAAAADGATLPEPYVITFSTSTGPVVLSSTLATYKVPLNQPITISFDSPLATAEPLQKYVEFLVNGSAVSVRTAVSDSQLIITPDNMLPRCAELKITISDSIPSIFGVTGGSSWTRSARTICQEQFSIGSSVQGRSIQAVSFGSGPDKIVFIGGMHGNEKSSTYTLNAWVDELERNFQQIPADKTIIIIPNHNPDGFAVNTRVNSRGVDLNRNFPSNDWATGVYIPPSIFLPAGGGSEPLSEPEASVLADYIIRTSPTLALTYHATARVVVSNGSGNSQALAELYAAKSGFSAMTSDEEDSIFGYPTTGEFETWLHDKHSMPVLLIELATQSSNEIQKQSPAMWAMITN